MGQRYRRMEDKKAWPGMALNQDFAKGRRLKPKVKKRKRLNFSAEINNIHLAIARRSRLQTLVNMCDLKASYRPTGPT